MTPDRILAKRPFICFRLPIAALAMVITLPAIFYAAVWMLVDSETLMTVKRDMILWKSVPLQAENRAPAVIILGGSGSLYSFDTPLLEKLSRRPAVNFGTQWGVSFFAAERAADLVIPGDIAVMPLEYDLYETTAAGEISYVESCYLLSQARRFLASPWQRLKALFGCDAKLAIYGMYIKILRTLGKVDPVNDMSIFLNAQGDILENTAGKNLIKIPFKESKILNVERPLQFPRLEELARRIQNKGGIFVLTFPAYPMRRDGGSAISNIWVDAIKEWAEKFDIPVASTPKAHSFPPNCFFDNAYHLHRGCTKENTKILFSALGEFL